MLAQVKQITSRILNFFSKNTEENTVFTTQNTSSPKLPNASKCLELFLNELLKNQVSESTIRNYSSDISQFLDFTHYQELNSALSEKNFKAFFLDQQHKGLKPSTIQRKIVSLKLFSQWIEKYYAEEITTAVKNDSEFTTPAPIQTVKISSNREWVLSPYFHLATLIIFFIFISILGYRQFFVTVPQNLAFPSSPLSPDRVLSFQGRLTDAVGNPITTATNTNFKLFDASSGGNQLWSSGTCSITPDQDGIFSTILGSSCGGSIADTVFSENTQVWLEVGVASDTLTPRQRIATVPYATNSETLQGFPITATVSATKSSVVVMNQWGEILLGEQSPKIRSVSGTFSISGSVLNLVTNSGSNGNIILDPDGTGIISVLGNVIQNGYFYTNGATISATYAGATPLIINGTGGQIFTVNNAGDVSLAGDLAINGGDLTSAGDLTLNPAGGNILFSDNTTLNIGGAGAQSYNFIAGSTAGNATATNDNDLYIEDVLEVDGSARFDGSVTLSSLNTAGGIVYTNGSGQLLTSTAGTVGECLKSGGTGAPTWAACSAGGFSGTWRISNGAHSPVNDTLDLLVGSDATSSAKFAVINVNSGTPTASLSAGVNGGTYLTASGTLQSTANQTLSIGGDTTGDITVSPRNGSGTTTFNGGLTQSGGIVNLNVSSNNAVNIGTGTSTGSITLGGAGTQNISLGNGAGNKTVSLGSNNTGSTTTIQAGTGGLSLSSTASDIALQTNTSGNFTFTNGSSTGLANFLTGNIKVGNGTPDVSLNGEDAYIEGTLEADGAVRFDNTLTLSQLNTDGGILYTNASGVISQTTVGTGGQCLQSNGGGAPTWGSCTGGAVNYMRIISGAISPVNDTIDFLVGSSATSSAKFAVINVNSGTPTASLSAGVAGGSYLSATGNLQTTANQTLTIGGTTTGDISFSPLNGNGGVDMNLGTARLFNLLGGNLKVGNGTPGLTQNGEDGYVEGTFEVDGQSQFDGNVDATNGLDITGANLTVGGSNFSVAQANGDITTAGDLAINGGDITASADLTISPAGNNVIFSNTTTLNVGGAAATAYNFFADSTAGNTSAAGDNDLYIQDQLEVDGATRLEGSVTMTGFTTDGGILYTNSSGVLSQTAQGSAGQCLQSAGGGTPTWGACSSNYWRAANGALSPVNDTFDFLVGNIATGSAKFAVINVNSGTPTASLSAGINGGAYFTAAGSLQTTANQSLAIGGATTGDISISPLNGAGGVDINLGADRLFNLLAGNLKVGNGTPGLAQNGEDGYVEGTFEVDGQSQFDGNVDATNGLDVTGANLTVGGSNFSVAQASGDITTAGDLAVNGNDITSTGDLTFSPAGNNILFSDNTTLNVGGATAAVYNFFAGSTAGNTIADGDNDLYIQDELEVDGAVRLDNSSITLSSFTNNGGLLYTNSSGVLAQTTVGSSGECLKSVGGGTPTWGACVSGDLWRMSNGGISPVNDTLDFLIGNTATTSAKFAVINVNSGTPTASLSAGVTGGAYLTATGTLQTTANQALTIGGNTTGDLAFSPLNGSGGIDVNLGTARLMNLLGGNLKVGNGTPDVSLNGEDAYVEGTLEADGAVRFDSTLTLSSLNTAGGIVYTNGSGQLLTSATGNGGDCLLSGGTGAPTWGSCGSGGLSGTWRISNGAHSPVNDTLDLLVGSSATSSAKFAVINVGSGTPTASLSAGATGGAYLTSNGTLQTTANQTLTLGGATTGDITLSPINGGGGLTANLGSARLFNVLGGSLQVGNATPTVALNGEDAFIEGTLETDGAVRFDNSSITLSSFTTDGGLLYTNSSGVLAQTAQGSAGQCLKSNAGGAPTWGACSSGDLWRMSNGAISPINDTLDFLIGNTATTSAKFAVINVNSGTPTASLSAGAAGGAYLSATGALQTTANQTLTLGGNTTGNISLLPLNGAGGVTVTSSLASVARTTDLVTLTQANDGSNNSTGNLLQLTNSDTGSTAALMDIAQSATSGVGISFTSDPTSTLISGTGTVLTSGTGVDLSVSALTSGTGINMVGTTVGTSISSFTGKALNISPTRQYTGNGSITDTGNLINISRTNAQSTGTGTFNVSGDLVKLASTCSQSGGSCADSSNILDIAQNYSSATGAVLDITNAGTGSGIQLTSSSTGVLATLNSSGAVTTADGLLIAATNGSGIITDALDVSDAEIVNAMNVGANTITGAGYLMTSTASGLTINSTGADLALQTTTSGNITGTVGASGLFNVLTGNLKVGNGTPDVSLNGEDAYIEGTVEIDGAARFDNSSFTLSTFTNNGGLLYTNGSGVLAQTAVGSSGECLKSIGGGTPTWGSCSSGDLWRISNGAISPINNTLDFLVGNTATTSAKFAVINVNSGTPTASLSAGAAGGAYLTSNGTLQTTANQALTIGGNTTGDINLSPLNGSGTVNLTGALTVSGLSTLNGTLAANGQFTLGDNGDTGAINTSDWDISSAGNLTGIGTIAADGNITLTKADPTVIFDSATATDTDFWAGVQEDAGGDDDDSFQIGRGTTPGSASLFTVLRSGFVGVGTTAPDRAFNVNSATGGNIRQTYNDSDGGATTYVDYIIDSAGDLTINTTGGDINISDTDVINIGGNSTDVAYNVIGDSVTSMGGTLNSDDDLYIEGDLEVDGAARFDSSSISMTTFTNNGGLLYTNGSGVLAQTAVGSSGECLKSIGGGAPTWGGCSSGDQWRISNGAISPINDTLDFLIGNTATTSAKFAVINVNSGTPTASLSAGAAGGAYLSATGALQTTAKQALTVGGANSGEVTISSPNSTTFTVNSANEAILNATNFTPGAAEGNSLGSATAEWEQLFLGDDNGIAFGLDQDWSLGYDEATDDRLELTTAGTSGMLISSATVSGTGLLQTFDSVTTGTGQSLSMDALTTGTGLLVQSTSTAFTTGKLANFEWAPTGSTEIFATGSLFNINLGQYGNLSHIFNVQDNGSDIFSVNQAIISNNLPVEFTAPGDVSVAYDLEFTNQVASFIKSSAPLTIEAGEVFENNDLTLKTYGTGALVVNAAGGSEFARSGGTVASFNRSTSDGTIISLQQDGTEEGTISVSTTTVSYNAFTGSHYALVQDAMNMGELVTMTDNNQRLGGRTNSEIIYGAKKTVQANDPKVLGAYLALLNPDQPESLTNPYLIMAVGNGEMWIADNGQNIDTGDYLISSSTEGHAMKDLGLFDRSYIIARAAEPVDWSTVTEEINGVKHKRISVLFENFTRDNTLKLADDGSLQSTYQLQENQAASSTSFSLVSTVTNKAIETVSALSQLIVGQIEAGLIKSQQLIANRITVKEELTSPKVTAQEVQTSLIKPSEGKELNLNLGSDAQNELQITNNNDQEIFTIDQMGNATASGTIQAPLGRFEQLQAQKASLTELDVNTATISGQLYLSDGRTINDVLSDNDTYLASLSAQTEQITQQIQHAPQAVTQNSFDQFLAELSGTADASVSAALATLKEQQHITLTEEDMVLAPDAVFIKEYLGVNGFAQLTTANVQNSLTIGSSMVLTDNSIAAIDTVLFLQPQRGVINLNAGMLVLKNDGNVELNGNLIVSGDVSVGKNLNTNSLSPLNYSSDFNLKLASGSAEVATQSSQLNILGANDTSVASINASGSAKFKELQTQGIVIHKPESIATDSGSLAEAEKNKTVGSAVIPSGATEITIDNNLVSSDTLIYLTATSKTQNQVLYQKAIETCSGDFVLSTCKKSFTVGIQSAVSEDIQFNYWLIQQQ